MLSSAGAYRDERETLIERVRDLEKELSAANESIARLQGLRIEEPTEATDISRITGLPKRVQIEHRIAHEITEDGYEAIAETLRTRLQNKLGDVSVVGRTLRHVHNNYEIRLEPDEAGGMRLSATGTYDNSPFGILLGGGCGFPTLGAPLIAFVAISILDAVNAGKVASGITAAVTMTTTVIGGLMLMKWLNRRTHTRGEERVQGALQAVLDVAAAHAKPKATRVATAPVNEAGALAEEYAQAEEEALQAEAEIRVATPPD